jgi:hypothetical protein
MNSQTLRVLDLLDRGQISVDETITIIKSMKNRVNSNSNITGHGHLNSHNNIDNPAMVVATNIIEPLL